MDLGTIIGMLDTAIGLAAFVVVAQVRAMVVALAQHQGVMVTRDARVIVLEDRTREPHAPNGAA